MSISLRDQHGADLVYLTLAIGWDPVRRKRFGRNREIDLNFAAVLFSGDQLVDVVYHEQLSSRDGSVRHHGDSTTGEGKGDNEIITLDLTRLGPDISAVLFLVTCYTGQPFDRIENAFCRLVDGTTGTELLRYDLAGVPYTGLVMGAVDRANGRWEFREVSKGVVAEHPVDVAPQLYQFLT